MFQKELIPVLKVFLEENKILIKIDDTLSGSIALSVERLQQLLYRVKILEFKSQGIEKFDIEEFSQQYENLLKELQEKYIPLGEEDRKEYYLNKRDIYNASSLSEIETAALFIFLNRTCFNGLYRVNSKGKFNVPHGKYANPRICDEDTILADSKILQKVDILCGDFEKTIAYASPDALFYFDPPYKPLSKTSSFNSYAKDEFDDNEQIRLRDFCHKIVQYKTNFILSNSDVKGKDENDNFFDEIYNEYHIQRVMATRMVNANPEKRGKLSELMISNISMNYR